MYLYSGLSPGEKNRTRATSICWLMLQESPLRGFPGGLSQISKNCLAGESR